MFANNSKAWLSKSFIKKETKAIILTFMVTLEAMGIGVSVLAASFGEASFSQSIIHFFAWIASATYLGSWRNESALSNDSGFVSIVKSATLAVPLTAFFCSFFGVSINFKALFIATVLGLSLVLFLRWLIRKIIFELRFRSRILIPSLIIGNQKEISHISKRLIDNPMFGYSVEEFIDSTKISGEKPNPTSESLLTRKIGAVFLCISVMERQNTFSQILWDARKAGVDVFIEPQPAVVSLGRTRPIHAVNSLLLKLDSQAFSRGAQVAKRSFDVAIALILLVLTLPLQIFIVLLILLIDRQRPIFTQLRVGKAGNFFLILKFRTMKKQYDPQLNEGAFEKAGNEIQFKLKSDPRVTSLGKVLRRFSLDELPQLVNVLLGQMSLVGPRPHVSEEVSKYSQNALRRLDIKPGLTGAWQVGGRSDLDWEKSVALDLDYIQNWSLSLDFAIIVKTVWAVLRGKGAY